MSKIRYILFFLFLISNNALSQQNKDLNIAVIDFVAKGVSQDEAGLLTDLLRSDLVRTRVFTVLDRNNMQKMLKEQAFQNSGCSDSTCAVEIGKVLNMKYMVVGAFSKFGSTYVLVSDMIDVESGEIVDSVKVNSFTIDGMIAECSKVVKQFAKKPSESANNSFVNTTTLPVNPIATTPVRHKTLKTAIILENHSEKKELVIDIGRYEKIRNRLVYNIYHNDKKIGTSEVSGFDGLTTTLVTPKNFKNVTFTPKNSYVKYAGYRAVGNWGFAGAFPFGTQSTFEPKDYIIESSLGLGGAIVVNAYLFGKLFRKSPLLSKLVQPGLEFNLGAYSFYSGVNLINTTDVNSSMTAYFEDIYFAPTFVTFNFLYRTMFSPYIGVGATYYISKVDYDSMEQSYNNNLYTTSDSALPSYGSINGNKGPVLALTAGVNLFRNKTVLINANLKLFSLDKWNGTRVTSSPFLICPQLAVLFNF